MSYLALYRKYRPVNFDEVVGQKYIVKILKNSIKNDKISHAYLFSGPRGTGKTSIAKLFAKMINCENLIEFQPCNKCPSCLAYIEKNNPDIIEMDAASNNGVDEIREIRDKVSLMPSFSKYKVYIIDEVHMLSSGAFNALLKTLEEPPKHIIFILATTEFYKVPETIVSRCQCFDFEKICVDDIVNKLKEIVHKENITIDDAALPLIAKYSSGGLRDAISMLDKLACCSNNITIEDFYDLRGLVTEEELSEIFNNIMERDIKEMFLNIENLSIKGKNLTLLAEELIEYFKNLLIETLIGESGAALNKNKIFDTIDILNDTITNMKKSSYSKALLEVGLLKIVNLFVKNDQLLKKEINDNQVLNMKQPNVINLTLEEKKEVDVKLPKDKIVEKIEMEDSYSEEKIIKQEERVVNLAKLIEENRKIRINNAFATADKKILEDLKIRWVDLSEFLHNKEFSAVVSYLLDGTIRVAGTKDIIISVAYSSILENALINIEKIETLLNIVSKNYYRIAFILDTEWEELKNKYINDIHAGIKYQFKEENKINYEELKEQNKNIEESEIVKEAVSLFGDDIIEIK